MDEAIEAGMLGEVAVLEGERWSGAATAMMRVGLIGVKEE